MSDQPKRAFAEAFSGNLGSTGYESEFQCAVIAEIGDTTTPEDLNAATCRLKHNHRILHAGWLGPARILLYFAALASAIWLLMPLPQTLASMRTITSGDMDFLPSGVGHSMDERTRLLIYGDESAADDDPARWHALWMSEPDNPAWFSRYAAMRFADEHTLDPELLGEASRIDPENGFWHLVAACIDADDILEKVTTPETGEHPEKTEWFAKDEDEVLRRIEMIRQAAAMPRLESRHLEWYQAAIPRLPPTAGFLQQIHTIALLAGEVVHGGMNLRKFPEIQEAAIRIAVERNDAELAERIIRDWHKICLSLTNDGTHLVELMVAHMLVSQPVGIFHQAAHDLDLDREMELLKPVLAAVDEVERHREALRNERDDAGHDQKSFARKGSILGALVSGRGPNMLINRPDHLDVSAFRPSRRMEHAFFDRLMVGPIVMITSLGVAIFGAFWPWAGRVRRVFAKRAMLLLPIWKLSLLGLLAGAGPLLWYLLITRLTPLGWHEWSLTHGIKTVFVQWGILAFLILFLPGLIASIAFEKERTIFAWRWPGGITPRVVASSGIVATLPASGMILFNDDQGELFFGIFWWLSLAFMGGVTIAAIWSWWYQRKEPLVKSPRRLAAGLFAAHARMLTLVLLCGWAVLTQFEEKTWASRDTLFVLNPDSPALSSHEAEIQRRLRAQVLDMLGPAWTE